MMICRKTKNRDATGVEYTDHESHNKLTQKSILLVTVLLFVACGLLGCVPVTAADPFDYITVSFSGVDSLGVIDCNLDENALVTDIIGLPPDLDDANAFTRWAQQYDSLIQSINISYAPEDNLSNGDSVHVVVSVSEAAQDKLKSGEKSFTVAGLKAVDFVDFFKDINLSFSGVCGEGVAELNVVSDSPLVQACSFRLDRQNSLCNGDTVTVSIGNVEELSSQYNVMPIETAKNFTVSNLPVYVSDVSHLPIEKVNAFIPQYLSEAREQDNFIFSHTEPIYYKTYFCVSKEDAWLTDKNLLMIFVHYDVYQNGEYKQTNYVPLKFSSIIENPDGTVELEYSNGFTDEFTTDIAAFLIGMENDYYVYEMEIPHKAPDEATIHEHTYDETTVNPTCTEEGYTVFVCSCGDRYTANVTPKRGHLYGSWETTKQPTTTETGEKQCACSRCNHVLTESIDKLDEATANLYENYIDPRIEVDTSNPDATSYYFRPVGVVDARTWGSPPSITITSSGGFYIVFYDKSGNKVEVTLDPWEGYTNRCVIFDDGTYQTRLIGSYGG